MKASGKQALSFTLCGWEDLAQMPFTLIYIQYMVTSVLQDQHGQKSVIDEE